MPRAPAVEIDLGRISSSEELHRVLQESLHFPDWYGGNWDAFWDSITGLVDMPETLKLIGWRTFADRLPRDAQLLQASLADMSKQYPQEASRVLYA